MDRTMPSDPRFRVSGSYPTVRFRHRDGGLPSVHRLVRLLLHCRIERRPLHARLELGEGRTRLEHPALVRVLGELPQETARLGDDEEAVAVEGGERVDERQLVLGARDGDVEEAALLLETL